MNEVAYRSLISGERRGVGPALLRAALRAASWIYGPAVAIRNFAFDRGWRVAKRVGVPVVSVGNITAGGTGKTPFVAWLVRWFQSRGMRPAILSRGYRSLDGTANDEKLVLDRLCPGVPHVQNRDRVAGARTAISDHQAQVLILDDGFQHRRLGRDLDVVLVDALNPWGYAHLLPRGLLREPVSSLRRAGLIVLTRADLASEDKKRAIVEQARRAGGTAPVVEVAFAPEVLVNAAGESRPLGHLAEAPVLAFCGIGNPAGFQCVVERCGLRAVAVEAFPDHHHYNADDLRRVAAAARTDGAVAVVTTEKDLVKIPAAELDGIPLWAVRIAARITANGEALECCLNDALVRARTVARALLPVRDL